MYPRNTDMTRLVRLLRDHGIEVVSLFISFVTHDLIVTSLHHGIKHHADAG